MALHVRRLVFWLSFLQNDKNFFCARLAGYVEILCGRMGLPIPDLSPQQMEHGSSRFSSNLVKN